MTPLEVLICELIATEGPMRLDRYMGLCLGHPQHGYYMTRDPLGDEGDFITAPEVSPGVRRADRHLGGGRLGGDGQAAARSISSNWAPAAAR